MSWCDDWEDTCGDWEDTCVEVEYDEENYDDQWERPEELKYEEFFECARVDDQGDDDGGAELYIGAHCADDDTTIKISVFYDEYCSNYAGGEYDPSDLTGQEFDEDALVDYYDAGCISCDQANYPYNDPAEEQEYGDDGNVEVEVLEICERLYEDSGKCNRHFQEDDEDAYQSQNQYSSETRVCNFISNIVEDKYDEDGVISVDYKTMVTDYIKDFDTEEVSDLQIVGIIFSLLACVFLSVYACQLNNYLRGELALKNRYYYGGQMARGTIAQVVAKICIFSVVFVDVYLNF